MSDHTYHQNLLIGAAVAAGVLGTLTSLLGSKKSGGWREEVNNHLLDTGEVVNKKMLWGGVAGGLVGAAAALLLAPKSGAELVDDIIHPFSHKSKHARSTSHASTSHKKKASHSNKTTHKAATKKSSHRRRSAIAKPKAETEKTTTSHGTTGA